MKNKNRNIFKRMTAMILAVILLCTNVSMLSVLAFGEGTSTVPPPNGSREPANSAGMAGDGAGADQIRISDSHSRGDTSNLGNFRAYLITMVKVQNVCGENQDYVSAKAVNPELTHCQYSAAYEYLTQYPSCFSSGSIMSEGLSKYALAVFKDADHIITNVMPDGGSINYMTEARMVSSEAFSHVFIRKNTELSGAGSGWKPTDLCASNILSNEVLRGKFIDGQLTLSEAKSLMNSGNLDAAANNVLAPLADSGKLTASMNGAWTKEQNGYKAYLLDYLLAINYMCGNAYDELISSYLENLNGDGSDSFVVPIIAVCQVYDIGCKDYVCSTLPDMLSYCANGNCVALSGALYDTSSRTHPNNPENTGSDAKAEWRARLFGSLTKKQAVSSGVFNYCFNWWAQESESLASWGGLNWAFTTLPTDIYGKPTGCIGYTYLALGGLTNPNPIKITRRVPANGGASGIPEPDPKPDYELPTAYSFKVIATSEQDMVNKGDKVEAKVELNIKLNNWAKLWEEFIDKGNPTVEVDTVLVTEKGNGSSAHVIDQIVKPAGMHKADRDTHMRWSDVSWESVKPYITGKQNITYIDKDIVINDKTTNLYLESICFNFPDGTQEWFFATGTLTFTDNIKIGADRVSWGEEDDTVVHYYSSIGKSDIDDNYVEIKEGAPGNEHFEAMAGVPTTENMYVGFGVTEFMVNMDGKADTSSGTRTYTYEYKNPECYGHDKPCELYCAGHSYTLPTHEHQVGVTSSGSPIMQTFTFVETYTDTDCSDDGVAKVIAKCPFCGAEETVLDFKAPYKVGSTCTGVGGPNAVDDNGDSYCDYTNAKKQSWEPACLELYVN